MLNLGELNRVVLALYREGRDMPLRGYQDWALDLIKGLIPFDSAWWGNAATEPPNIHWIHLLNCDASILDTYGPYMMEDFFRAALMANPGKAINTVDLTTREGLIATRMYREWASHYHVEWSLGTLLRDPNTALQEFLTVWRHDPAKPFSEDERQMKELLMPHLTEAFRAVRLRHFLRGIDTRGKAWALADDHGYIREATSPFLQYLHDHWRQWKGNLLPEALAQCVIGGRNYESKTLTIELTPAENLRFLQVRPRTILDKLTAREAEIVRRYAAGETYAEIAKAVRLAPATVRNHISHGFSKLAVKNKAQLAALLAAKDGANPLLGN